MLKLFTSSNSRLTPRFTISTFSLTRPFTSTSPNLFSTQQRNPRLRNLAIVAHVDHGKTTLVDKLLTAAEKSLPGWKEHTSTERVMDAGALEIERGITITSKATRLDYIPSNKITLPSGVTVGGGSETFVLNIVDTPGHADFAGEVDRILSMVDGVILVLDAGEGAMAQTKYVLSRALQLKKRPVVFMNKLDRGEGLSNIKEGKIESNLFDLFDQLGADDEQLDYPTYYGAARMGWSTSSIEDAIKIVETGVIPEDGSCGMNTLLDAMIEHIPSPSTTIDPDEKLKDSDENLPFAMAATMVGFDKYLGRTVTGKVYQGTVNVGDKLTFLRRDGAPLTSQNTSGNNGASNSLTGLFCYRGVTRAPLEGLIVPGDIITLSGVPDSIAVGDTLTSVTKPVQEAILTPPLAPPTLSMDFGANDGPLCGKEGTIVTSSRVRDRLKLETDNNVTLTVGPCDTDAEKSVVFGRGELQLGILIEQMRREGFEMCISPPKIVTQVIDGEKMEPFEEVTVDVDAEYSGAIMNSLTGERKGNLIKMEEFNGKSRMVFEMPSRGLLGFGPDAATMTRGSAVITHTFTELREWAGPLGEALEKGKLVSSDSGKASSYALNMIAERGVLFVDIGDEVYPGMVIGENSRAGDMEVNVTKFKALTNIRTVNKEEKASIPPCKRMSVEEMIAYMGDDEVIEVTPKSVRLRKKELDAGARARAMKTKKKQRDSAEQNKLKNSK